MTLPKILPAILLIMMTAVSCTTLTEKEIAAISADGNFENQLVSAGNTMLKAFRENDSGLFSQQLSGELKKEFGVLADAVLENGYSPEYGARPLRRSITRLVEDPYATAMVNGRFSKGDFVRAYAEDGIVKFEKKRK